MAAQASRDRRRETGFSRGPRFFCPRSCRGHRGHSGAVLLEVLISLGLLVFGLAVVGLRVVTSLDTARRTDRWTRGMVLADIKLAELDAGVVRFKATDDELKGYFGIDYPGYTWRIKVEPTDTDELFMLTLEIGYNDDPILLERQKNDPTYEIDIEDEGTLIVRTVYRLMPVPADLDLNRDFGIDLEELQAASELGGEIGGGGGGAGGGDGGGAGDLWQLVSEFLTAHPEILNDSGGIDLNAVADLPPEDFQLAMQILNQFVGREANFGSLQDQLDQELGGSEDRGGQDQGGRAGGGIAGGGGGIGPGGDRGGPGGDRGGPGEARGGGRRGGRGGEPGGDQGPGDAGGGRRFGRGRDNDAGPDDRGPGGPPDDRGLDERPPNDRRNRDRNSNDNSDDNRGGRDRRSRDRNATDRNSNDRAPDSRGNVQGLRQRLRQQREGQQNPGR